MDEFKLIWWKFKDSTDFLYTDRSGDWEDHYRMGSEMLALYEAEYSKYPLDSAQFQVTIKTDLFPDTEYEGLQYTTILDIISTVPHDHPLLPPLKDHTGPRKVIVDLKTSAASYYTDPRLSALDSQLRDYAWATGIQTVAFLVLVKNHSSIGTGDWVTVLSGPDQGKKYQVFNAENSEGILVLSKTWYDEFVARKKDLPSKGKKEALEALLTEYYYKGKSFRREDLTKQKIQFLPAVISEEDMAEARSVAQREAVEISDCSLEGFWPKKPGVRWPSAVCTDCDMLGHCISDPDLVKEKLIQIGGEF